MNETHFSSLAKCQSDYLCSESSGFTEHQFFLIISLFSPQTNDAAWSWGFISCLLLIQGDRHTDRLSLPFFPLPFPLHMIPASAQAGALSSTSPFLLCSLTPMQLRTALWVSMNRLIFLPTSTTLPWWLLSAGCAGGASSWGWAFLTGCMFELTLSMHELCSKHMLRALNELSRLLLITSWWGGSWW